MTAFLHLYALMYLIDVLKYAWIPIICRVVLGAIGGLIYVDDSKLHISCPFLFYSTLCCKDLVPLLCLSGLWFLTAVLHYELSVCPFCPRIDPWLCYSSWPPMKF